MVPEIEEMKELPKIVAQTEVGKTVDVKVWRNKKEITKKIKLGRLETSDDFKVKKKEKEKVSKITEIKYLKIKTRVLTNEDIISRNLPKQTTGLLITGIANDSPVNYLKVNNIIIEAQKKKIKSTLDLEKILEKAIKTKDKTVLIVIYNNQNQRRYIGCQARLK